MFRWCDDEVVEQLLDQLYNVTAIDKLIRELQRPLADRNVRIL